MKNLFLLLPFFAFLISSLSLSATCKVANGDTITTTDKGQSFELKGKSMLQKITRMQIFRVNIEASEEETTTKILLYSNLGIALLFFAIITPYLLFLPSFIFLILFAASMTFSWIGLVKSLKVLRNKKKKPLASKTRYIAILGLSICILSIIFQLLIIGLILVLAASFG
jgi:hypothetical protein